MKRIINLLIIVTLFVFSGCASLKGMISNNRSVRTTEPALSPAAPQNEIVAIVGFNTLDDKRPQTAVSYMTSVKEKLTDGILDVLKGIQFLKDAHSPASESDDVVISGEIRKFNWEYYNTMISYIPGLNVLPFFGLPSTRSRADVEIYLEFKNNKTNEVILKITQSYSKNNSYNMYSFNPNYANSELALCFDVVLKKIKEDILLNKNKILETVKVEPPKISKPAQETKSTEETKPAEEVKPAQETKPTEETKPSGDLKVITPPEGQNPEVK